jgi:hypothetical protein
VSKNSFKEISTATQKLLALRQQHFPLFSTKIYILCIKKRRIFPYQKEKVLVLEVDEYV